METAAAAGRRSRRGHAVGERLRVPIRYALLRLRRNASRTLLVALGIAVGAAVLAMTVVASASVQDRAVQRALAQLAPSDRAVQTVWSGVPAQSTLSFARLDRLARAATTPILGQAPFTVEVFRQATWGGVFVNLGAVDGLGRWIDVRSGRLPKRCTPHDCELVQIGGAPAVPKLPFLHVVGRATLKPGAPLQSYFGGEGKHPPVLLANGVRRFVHTPLPDSSLVARTYGWIVPVSPRSIHDWDLAKLGTRLDTAQSSLVRRSDIFSVVAPTDTIDAIRATSRIASERLLILGGDAAVLLLGFAMLASTRLRRDHQELRRRLTWAGASRAQTLLVSLTEVAAVTLVASTVGWAVGTLSGAALAGHLGSPGSLVVQHSVFTGRVLAIAAALAVVTVVSMLAALRVDSVGVGGMRVTVADVAALGALAAVLLALARGKADASSLQGQSGTGVLLLLLPGLVLFVLAVATARLLAPALRGLERLARRARPSARIALLSLAREPGAVVLTVVFFVLSVGIAVFAFAYRTTLVQGEREQARYEVPAPYVVQEDLTKLVTVQQVALPSNASQVVRESGFVGGTRGADFTLLALPPAALARIDGWRNDFSARSPSELAAAIRPQRTPSLRGIALTGPRLTLPFTTTGEPVSVTAIVANRRGDFTPLNLGAHDPGTHDASVPLPPESRGGRLVALRLAFPLGAATVAAHHAGEAPGAVTDVATGTIRLGSRFAGWFGTEGVRSDGRVLHFVVNSENDAVIRPHEPLEGELVPVIVSPDVERSADSNGVVTLHVANSVILGQIVASTRYFPSVDGDVVVADLPTWLTVANTAEPGVTTASEAWLPTRPRSGLPLDVTSQRAREHELTSDPLARGAVSLLLVTALVGLVLAAVGVFLTVVGDLRDERGALADLEAQGAAPADLRRHVLLRASVVGALGIGGGVAAGAIVGTLVVAVVTVTAGAEDAVPPLLLSFGWPSLLIALAALALASAAGAFAAARRSL